MPAIFDLLYREYCRARLAEMRKQLLITRTESQEVPEANCDDRHPDSATGRGSGNAKRTRACLDMEPYLVVVVTVGEIAASLSTSGG